MGELILARTGVAANPYYIDELSLNIYSLEELSYYIYHNVWLLNHDFMSLSLADWVGKELGLAELSERLKGLIADDAPLTAFVSEILTENGYLTTREIRDTLSVLKSFENKSEAECRKMRADRLMKNGRIVDSVYEYENLLKNRENISVTLLGDIRHNLGVCYAKLFFLPQAADCFREAYEANRNRESLYSYLATLLLMEDEEKFSAACERYLLSSEEKNRLRQRVQEVLHCRETKDFANRVNRLSSDYSDREAYRKELSHIINGFEEDYRAVCRI